MATYVQIATVTVGSGGAANIQFTSIPATYTDLLLKLSLRTTVAYEYGGVDLEINGSTANFSGRELYGSGGTPGSATRTNRIYPANGSNATSSTFSNSEIYFPNYTASQNKSFSADIGVEHNGATNFLALDALLWSNTNAITSIKMTPDSSASFVQHSTATLYGISKS